MAFEADDSGLGNALPTPPPIPSSSFSPNMGDLPGMPTSGGGFANAASPPLFDALMQQPDWSNIGGGIIDSFKQTPPTEGVAPMGELQDAFGPSQATTISVNGGPDQFPSLPSPPPKNFFDNLGDQVKGVTDDIGNWYDNFKKPADIINAPTSASSQDLAGSALDKVRDFVTPFLSSGVGQNLSNIVPGSRLLDKNDPSMKMADNVLGALGDAMGQAVGTLPGVMVQQAGEPGSLASNMPDQGKILNGLLESILPAVGVAEPGVNIYKQLSGQNIQSLDAINAQGETLNQQGEDLQKEIDSANSTGVVPPDLEQKLKDYQDKVNQFNKTSQQSESFWNGPGGLALNLIAQGATMPEQFSLGSELFKAQLATDPGRAAQQLSGSLDDARNLIGAIAQTASGKPGGIDTWNPQQIAGSVSNLISLAAMIHGPLSMFIGGHGAKTISTEIPANGETGSIGATEATGIPTETGAGGEAINSGQSFPTGENQIPGQAVGQQGSTEAAIRAGASPETIGNAAAPINADFTNGNEQAPGIAANNAEAEQSIRETSPIPPATGNGNAGNVNLFGSPEMDFGLEPKTPYGEVSDQTIQDLTGLSPKDYFAGLTPEQQAQVRNQGMSPDAVDAAKADQLETSGTDVQNRYPKVTPEQPVTEAPAHFNERTMRPMETMPAGANARTPEDIPQSDQQRLQEIDKRVREIYSSSEDLPVEEWSKLGQELESLNAEEESIYRKNNMIPPAQAEEEAYWNSLSNSEKLDYIRRQIWALEDQEGGAFNFSNRSRYNDLYEKGLNVIDEMKANGEDIPAMKYPEPDNLRPGEYPQDPFGAEIGEKGIALSDLPDFTKTSSPFDIEGKPQGPLAQAVQTPEDVLKAFMTDRARMDNRVRALFNQLKDIVDPYGILKDKLRSMNVDSHTQATAPFRSPELAFNLNRPDPAKLAEDFESRIGLYLKPRENPVADRVAKEHVNDLHDMADNPALLEYNLLDHEATHQYDYVIYKLDRDSPTPWSDMVYNMIHDIPDEVLQGWAEMGVNLEPLIGGKLDENAATKVGKDLLEMSVHSWQRYENVPGAQYAWGIPEVYANNVKDPQKFNEISQIYGRFREAQLANRFGAKSTSTATTGRPAEVGTNNAGNRTDQAIASQPVGNLNAAAANQGSGTLDWQRTSQGIPVNPLPFTPENVKHLDAFDHIHNEWMLTPAEGLPKVADKFKSAVEDLINSVRSGIDPQHADLIRSVRAVVQDAHDTHPDGGSLESVLASLDELEREANMKGANAGAGNQDLTPIVKRGEDFSRLGEYDVTIGNKSYKIYRDPGDSSWYEANTGKHFTQNYLGSTRAEALDRLVERTRLEGANAETPQGGFKEGDQIQSRVGMKGVVTKVIPKGLGWGDPGPSYVVKWENGYESRVRGRDAFSVEPEGPNAKTPELPPSIKPDEAKETDARPIAGSLDPKAQKTLEARLNLIGGPMLNDFMDMLSKDDENAQEIYKKLGANLRKSIDAALKPAPQYYHGTRTAPNLGKDFGGLHIGTRRAAIERLRNTPSQRVGGVPGAEKVYPVDFQPKKPFNSPDNPMSENDLFQKMNGDPKWLNSMKSKYDSIYYRNDVEDAGSVSVLILDKNAAKIGTPEDVVNEVEGRIIPKKVIKAQEVVTDAALNHNELPQSNQLTDDTWLKRAQQVMETPNHPAGLQAGVLVSARDAINLAIKSGVPTERLADFEQAYDLAMNRFKQKMDGAVERIAPHELVAQSEVKDALTDVNKRTTKAAQKIMSKPAMDGTPELDAKMAAEEAGYTLDSARDILNKHVQYGYLINNKTKQILKITDPRVQSGSWSPITITGKSGVDFKFDPTTNEMKILNENHLHLGYASDIVKSWDEDFKTYLKGELRRGTVFMPENLSPEQNMWRNGIEVKGPGGQPFRPKTQAEQHEMLAHMANIVNNGLTHPFDENPMSKSDIWNQWTDFGRSLASLGLSRAKPPAIPDVIGQVSRGDLMKRNKALSKRAEAASEFSRKLEDGGYDPSELNYLDHNNIQPPGGPPKDPTAPPGGEDFNQGPNREVGDIWNEAENRYIKLAAHGPAGRLLGNALFRWTEHVMGMQDKWNLVGDDKLAGSWQEAQYNAGKYLVDNVITPQIRKMFPDVEVRNAITHALDVNDVAPDQRANERQARIDALPTQAARDTAWAIASLHDFMGNVMRARRVTNTAVDFYVTHAFKPQPKEKGWQAKWQELRDNILYGESSGGPSASAISRFARKRQLDPETGDYKYPTIASLEENFEREAYHDVSDLLNIHMNSALYALSMGDMKDFLGSHEWKPAADGIQHPAIVSFEEAKKGNLSGAIDQSEYRTINLGSYKKPLMGYLVHKDLADQLERFSHPYEGPGPLNAAGRALVKLGSLFRGGTFISFFHSLSVHSIIAAKIASEDGLKGLLETGSVIPAWQKSLRMTASGRKLLNTSEGQKYVSEKLIGLGGMKPPEAMTQVEGMEQAKPYYQKIPGIKQMYDFVWNQDIAPAAYGLAKYLDDSRRAQLNRPLSEAEEAQHYSQIVAEVNRATGLIPREDIPNWFKAISKAMLTGSEFTYTQASMLTRALPFSYKAPGLKGMYATRERVPVKGGEALQDAQIKRANRLGSTALFYGALGMTIASELENVISGYLTDQSPNNIWDNFLDSPEHTFDVYHGKDANGRRLYWHNPLYGAFEELANYGMAYAGSKYQGKSDGDALRSALARMTGKIVPTVVAPLEALTNIELYKFVGNYTDAQGNPNVSLLPDPKTGKGGDSALNQLSQLLDAIGIPQGPGQLRDRLAFTAMTYKNMIPFVGLSPTTVPEQNAEGIMTAADIMSNPGAFATQAALGAGLKALGTYEQYGPQRSTVPGYQGLTGSQIYAPVDRAKAQASSDAQLLFQIANQPPSNDPKENEKRLQMELAIAARNNWSPDQMTKIIQQQQQAFDKAQFQQVQQALEPNAANRAANAVSALTGSVPSAEYITVNGQNITLSAEDSATLQKSLVSRRLDVLNMLNTDPQYRSLSAFDKAAVQDSFNRLADQLTRQQAAQQLGYMPGALTDQQVHVVLNQTMQEREAATQQVMNTQAYLTADPAEQKRMVQTAQSFASSLVSDAYLKGIKGVTPETMPIILNETLQAQTATRTYVESTPWFQMADPGTQSRMLRQYDSVAAQLARNEVVNMPPAVVSLLKNTEGSSPFNATAVTMAAKNIVNTQEATLELLHNQDFYMNADPNTQAQLDSKYTRLARNIAAYQASGPASGLVTDYREVPAAFKYGLQSSIVGSIQGEQAQFDLQSQFGGADVLNGYAAELAAIKKNYRMSVGANASTTTINRTEKNIEAAFLYNNPDYAAYLKAQAQFKKYSPDYSLTAALNNSEYTRAAQLTQAYGVYVGDPLMGSAGSITGDVTANTDTLPIDVSQIDPNDVSGSLIAQGIDPNSVDPQTLDNIVAQTQMNG